MFRPCNPANPRRAEKLGFSGEAERRTLAAQPPKDDRGRSRKSKALPLGRKSRRIWNEHLCVCDNCLPVAQTQYPTRSFVDADGQA